MGFRPDEYHLQFSERRENDYRVKLRNAASAGDEQWAIRWLFVSSYWLIVRIKKGKDNG
jgi:hypothetical protein